jgi:hypothetical protein
MLLLGGAHVQFVVADHMLALNLHFEVFSTKFVAKTCTYNVIHRFNVILLSLVQTEQSKDIHVYIICVQELIAGHFVKLLPISIDRLTKLIAERCFPASTKPNFHIYWLVEIGSLRIW